MPIKSPAITPGIEPPPEASFYIPATEPTTRLRRTMKRDDCFLVFDSHGDIGASPGGPDGLFNCDTRYLSHFELLINGVQPLLLGSNLSDDNCAQCGPHKSGHLLRQAYPGAEGPAACSADGFRWRSTLFQRFAVRNFSADRVRLLLSITFDNDFADVFEVLGNHRARRGAVRSVVEGSAADFVNLGLEMGGARNWILSGLWGRAELPSTDVSE